MNKAGGIIAIIAGVISLGWSFVTMAIGGVGTAFSIHTGNSILTAGWLGIVLSILTIILGAVGLSSKSKAVGLLLLIATLIGIIVGNIFLAIFMGMGLIGALLVLFGVSSDNKVQAQDGSPWKAIFGATLVIGLGLIIAVGVVSYNDYVAKAHQQEAKTTSKMTFEELEAMPASDLTQRELGKIYNIGSTSTDIQRENTTKEIVGKVVDWNIEVYEVTRLDDDYVVQTADLELVNSFVRITPRDNEERQYIETQLKTGSVIQIKGVISKVDMRMVGVSPAMLHREFTQEKSASEPINPTAALFKLLQDVNSAEEVKTQQEPEIVAEQRVNSPSFDCNKARSAVEMTICADPELAQLDRELSELYKEALSFTGSELRKAEQLSWLKERNACLDRTCLVNSYQLRLDILSAEMEDIDL